MGSALRRAVAGNLPALLALCAWVLAAPGTARPQEGDPRDAQGIARAEQSFALVVSDILVGAGEPGTTARPRRLIGCGVVIDGSGHLLTTSSVVGNARSVTVVPFSGPPCLAEVVGIDPVLDLAVVRVPEGRLPEVPIGNSDSLRTGTWVTLLAADYGSGPVASLAILTGRSQEPEEGEDVLRVYAPIRPGDSGAVLLDERGQLVGIVSATVDRPTERRPSMAGFPALAGYVEGIALPVNEALQAAWRLIERGPVGRGFLGVSIQAVTKPLAQTLGLEPGQGAYVVETVENGPAALAGILPGDVILSVDGEPIKSVRDLHRRIVETPPLEETRLSVLSGGERRSVAVRVGDVHDYIRTLTASFAVDPNSPRAAVRDAHRNEIQEEVAILRSRLEELETRLRQMDRTEPATPRPDTLQN